jgi:single-stranded-DNA-specific exonuclease
MRKIDSLLSEARKAAVLIRNFQGTARLVSHYDADGIAAASIMAISLSREGRDFRLSVVKQLSEGRIRGLAEEKNQLTIFTDLGSGHLQIIQDILMPAGSKVIVLDHHQIKGDILPENRGSLVHVNPVCCDINENLSGAGVAYLLSKELDPENSDLSYLGVVGAIGDSQMGLIEDSWGLSGPNKDIVRDARKSERISVRKGLRIWGRYTRPLHKAIEYCTEPLIPGISGSESASVQFLTELGLPLKNGDAWRTLSDLGEEEQKALASAIIKQRISEGHKNPHEIFGEVYELPSHPPEFRSAEEFATILNACGKLGRPYTGISMCMGNPSSFEEAKGLLSDYRKGIGRAIKWLNQNRDAIKTTVNGTYMQAGGRISEHIISNVVSIFNKSGFVPCDRPVFAFADSEEGIKVSARAHDRLVENGLNMERIVSRAAVLLGGEGGGHKAAAGATIPKGSQEAFISYIEKDLQDAHTNLNTPQQETLVNFEADHGTAKAEGRGREEGRGEEGAPASTGPPAERSRFEKMEGQGLVRYFGPKNVQ